MEQQEEKSKQTYNKIIQAGREILNKKDYYETVVEEIAQHAGVAKGTIFFYFKTKENLFREILFSLIDELTSSLDEILLSKEHPLIKLKKLYDRYVEFNLQNMNLFMTIRKQLISAEPKTEEIKQRLESISKKLLPLVEEMFNKGLVKRMNPKIDIMEIIPSMILMYTSAVSSMVFFYKDKVNEIKEIFWNILLHGMLNEDISIEMLVFNNEK